MTKTKRKWDLLTKEKREQLLKEIVTYFRSKQEQEIGVVASEDILDFFLDALGAEFYNKAIKDAKESVKQNNENLEVDLDMLMNK